jgi:hypothetical protein
MRLYLPAAMVSALALAAPCLADAPGPLRRLALIVGSNHGTVDRVPLRYAVTDADRFADLVTRMGGVAASDRIVLRDPNRRGLMDALAATAARAGSAKAAAQRVEAIVYFSGHADEQGLMLGREVVPYADLKRAIQAIGADVGITILDACASGAITRLKGGQAQPAFLSDVAREVQGYAFLTSSSEDEAAQESERLRGSFFTHALLTGLRGAADVTGDGKVTLNEAYQFAFNETLVQTTPTQAGAQHPAYDIKMAGTGDVVMTDVRQTSASLILGEAYDGRFVVLSGRRHLVAELYKPAGRKVELGLEPGEYDVYFSKDRQLLKSTVSLREGQHQELTRASLKEAQRLPSRLRGFDAASDPRLPRIGIRYSVRSGTGINAFGDNRMDLVLRPNDRWAVTPRVAFGTGPGSDYGLGVHVDFRFRPGRDWRPFVGFGIDWESRSNPGPSTFYIDGEFVEIAPPAEIATDRTYVRARAGLERRLSRRWSFVTEMAYDFRLRERWGRTPTNWYSWSNGAGLGVTLGLSFNFWGQGRAKGDAPETAPATPPPSARR